MARHKVRIRFRKAGDLRMVSHHDLMRCFARMLRRAALPFRSSEGFHPKPRLSFPLSLALGIVGCEEVVDLELDEDNFVGGGVYLFSALLEQFLGLYVSLNSFSQLSVSTRQRKEVLRLWPPRAGRRILL